MRLLDDCATKESDRENKKGIAQYYSPNNMPTVEHLANKAECARHWEGADSPNTIDSRPHAAGK
jgi:hypothetical protein